MRDQPAVGVLRDVFANLAARPGASEVLTQSERAALYAAAMAAVAEKKAAGFPVTRVEITLDAMASSAGVTGWPPVEQAIAVALDYHYRLYPPPTSVRGRSPR